MIIDMHAHVVPAQFPEAPRSAERRWPRMQHVDGGRANVLIDGKNFRTVSEVCWHPERRIAGMQAEGVDAQAISPMPELLSYWLDAEAGLAMCRYLNEFIADLVRQYPGQFYGLGNVPLQDPDLAARELATLRDMGLIGIELGSNILGKSLGEERFHPFFSEVERLELAVFVHALHPTMLDRLVGPKHLDNAVGFPTDVGLTAASLVTGQVLAKYPRLRIGLSHGGGSFPFFLARIQHSWSGTWNEETEDATGGPLQDMLPNSPASYARMMYYDALLFDRRAIQFLIEMMGVSQVVVGTDFPFVRREEPVGKTLRNMSLSDEALEAITHKNCRRFLGLE